MASTANPQHAPLSGACCWRQGILPGQSRRLHQSLVRHVRSAQAGINNSSTRLLPEGVTIVTARGTVGKIALVGTPMTMNQSCYGLQGKNKFYTYFSTRALISELQRHAHGSVFDTITRDTLAGIDVVMPCNELMNSFDLIVQPILDKIKTNLQESQTLSVMRDSLLPKLLSGEIKNVTYAAA